MVAISDPSGCLPGGFGVVSRVRRVTDGKILVWKEMNYHRMNKKERRMMITEARPAFLNNPPPGAWLTREHTTTTRERIR